MPHTHLGGLLEGENITSSSPQGPGMKEGWAENASELLEKGRNSSALSSAQQPAPNLPQERQMSPPEVTPELAGHIQCPQDRTQEASSTFLEGYSQLGQVKIYRLMSLGLKKATSSYPLCWRLPSLPALAPEALIRSSFIYFQSLSNQANFPARKSLCHINFTSFLLLTQSPAKFRGRRCLRSLWRWGCASQGSKADGQCFFDFSPCWLWSWVTW